jgi:hypothetical protein
MLLSAFDEESEDDEEDVFAATEGGKASNVTT